MLGKRAVSDNECFDKAEQVGHEPESDARTRREWGENASIVARFWSRVYKSADPDGCWIFLDPDIALGGRLRWSGHQFSWELHFGPVPDGLRVCRRCTTVGCIRPNHLFLAAITSHNDGREPTEHLRLTLAKAEP